MQKNIHPKYKEVTVKLPEGDEFVTKSTYKGDVIHLEISTKNHPAWNKNKGNFVNKKAGKIAKFSNKFGNIGSIKSDNNSEESSN